MKYHTLGNSTDGASVGLPPHPEEVHRMNVACLSRPPGIPSVSARARSAASEVAVHDGSGGNVHRLIFNCDWTGFAVADRGRRSPGIRRGRRVRRDSAQPRVPSQAKLGLSFCLLEPHTLKI